MRLGIFAKTFARPTLAETLDAVKEQGLDVIQFNLSCVGLPTLPDRVDEAAAKLVREETEKRNVSICAVSGTYNMAHPNTDVRREGLRCLDNLAAMCGEMGAPVITLCTGTRDLSNKWKWHPDNSSRAAWDDMIASVEQAVKIAEKHGVTLGIEPETANVIDSAQKAKQLLEQIQSSHLKIVMDAANLFNTDNLPRMQEVINEAFQLLGDDIILAHAKDFATDDGIDFQAAGTGMLDYDYYLQCLQSYAYKGPLIMHSLREDQVPESVAFLQNKLG